MAIHFLMNALRPVWDICGTEYAGIKRSRDRIMMEPRSTATIRALASLAELSANQLEEGVSVDEVIATLRKAAEAVRIVVDADDESELGAEEIDIVQDLTPMDLSAEDGEEEKSSETEAKTGSTDVTVLNAG